MVVRGSVATPLPRETRETRDAADDASAIRNLRTHRLRLGNFVLRKLIRSVCLHSAESPCKLGNTAVPIRRLEITGRYQSMDFYRQKGQATHYESQCRPPFHHCVLFALRWWHRQRRKWPSDTALGHKRAKKEFDDQQRQRTRP